MGNGDSMKMQTVGTWTFRFLLSGVLLAMIWATWHTIEKVHDKQIMHITTDEREMAVVKNDVSHHINQTHQTLVNDIEEITEDIDEIKVDMKLQQKSITNIEKAIIEINAKIPD